MATRSPTCLESRHVAAAAVLAMLALSGCIPPAAMVPPNHAASGYVGVAASVDPVGSRLSGVSLDGSDWFERRAGGAGQIWAAGSIQEIMDIGGVLAMGNNSSSFGVHATVWPARDSWRFGVQVSAGLLWAGVALPTFAPVVPERVWFYAVPTVSLSSSPLMGEAGLAIQPGTTSQTLQIGGRVASDVGDVPGLGAAGVVVSYLAPIGKDKRGSDSKGKKR